MKYLLSLIGIWCALILNAESTIEFHSKHFKTTDGLPHNTVRFIKQDSKGFLWLATLDGIGRYDGHSFRCYRENEKSWGNVRMADNRIYRIREDSLHFLWISTETEVYHCYDLLTEHFVDFIGCGENLQQYSRIYLAKNNEVWLYHNGEGIRRVVRNADRTMSSITYSVENGNFPDNWVNFVEEDVSGKIWVGTAKGLVLFDGETVLIKDSVSNFKLASRFDGSQYFMTDEGDIYVYDKNRDRLKKTASIKDDNLCLSIDGVVKLEDQWIVFGKTTTYHYNYRTREILRNSLLDIPGGKVLVDEEGDSWIYNKTGFLYYVSRNTGKTKALQLFPNSRLQYIDYERYQVARDAKGIAWISTYGNGLFSYDIQADKLEHYTAEMSNSPLVSNYLLTVFADKSNGLWVGYDNAGLSYIGNLNNKIRRIYPERTKVRNRSNDIRMLVAMDDDIWVSTREGGLYKYGKALELKEKYSLGSNVYALNKDKDGILWLGTRGKGLKVGDKWYRNNPSDASSLSFDHIFSILRDSKDRMWIATFGGGLNLAVPKDNGEYRFMNFFCSPTNEVGRVRTLLEDKRGMIWMGTNDGLYIFHPDSLIENASKYHSYNRKNGTFNSNEIKCLYMLRDGSVAVGTSGAGLNVCVPSSDYSKLNYVNYNTEYGLVHNAVTSIQEDDNGYIWIATQYGLSRLNPQRRSFENNFFSPSDLSNVYAENSVCMKEDGILLFGTNDGMKIIDPAMNPDTEKHSEIVLTDVYVNGTLVVPDEDTSPLKKSLAYSDEMKLDYYQSSFEIHFSTFNYADKGQTQYKYWLENYDKTWGETSALNFASYKYLEPGTYLFHVKACDNEGIWNMKETTLKIVIAPPFWKSAWAMLMYVFLSVGLAVLIFRVVRNFNRLNNRILLEKQLTEYKLVFFTNVSHEFRTPLTLIQTAMEKIRNHSNLPKDLAPALQSMDKNTHRMLRLINQFLEFRKMQNNKLSLALEETDVVEFLKDIYRNFEEMAEQKGMDYEFHTSHSYYKMYVDKGFLDKITYNLLSNAFKYTPSKGKIVLEVQIDERKKQLNIQVTDTGVGVPKEKQPELFKRFMQSSFSNNSLGIGLHLTHELVTVHKGSIVYHDNPEGGSVFIVTLPTDSSIYNKEDFLVGGNVLLKEENGTGMPQPALSEVLPDSIAQPMNRQKILVVEDDADIRLMLSEEIGKYFEVDTAENGLTGLEKIQSGSPDLVICDVMMPGMNGFQLTKKVKEHFETCHIPIILLTALGSEEKQLEGIEVGADAYISKPFSMKYLIARVFGLIAQREKLRRKFMQEPGLVHTAICSTDRDKEFAERLTSIIETNMDRIDFSAEEFAQLMGLSRTVFYNKVRGFTGYAPIEYLRLARLKKAAELLLSTDDNVSEIAYKVGFNDPFYFSRCFKAQFGVTPSVYKKGQRAKTDS